jgi:hypothetical protein
VRDARRENFSTHEAYQRSMRVKHNRARLLSAAALVILVATAALAHRPVLERSLAPGNTFDGAAEVTDPTSASQAIYGSLGAPGEVDFYKFTAGKGDTIPVEALVPVRPSNRDFRPWVAIVGKSVAPTTDVQLPFALPEGLQAHVIRAPDARTYFYEPYSVECLYHGAEEKIQLTQGETYYVAVFEPERRTGTYSLGLGSVENFEGTSKVGTVWNVLAAKLGLAGSRSAVPLLDLFAIFVSLAGFGVGLGTTFFSFMSERLLGADSHTARAQTVASRLAWLGLLVGLVGSALLYRESLLSGVAVFQAALVVILILLQVYLGIRLARRARKTAADPQLPGLPPPAALKNLTISHALSLLCWCGLLFLFAWYALMLR